MPEFSLICVECGREIEPGAGYAGLCLRCFAIEDGPRHYLPIRHECGRNLPEAAVWAYLKDQAAVFEGSIVGAKLGYDLDYLAENGVVFVKAKWFRDVQVADPLIYNLHMSYSLDAIAERMGLPGKDESLLKGAAIAYGVHPKGGLWRLPAELVGPYAEQDVALPHQLLRRQEKLIEEKNLQQIWDLESQLLHVHELVRR